MQVKKFAKWGLALTSTLVLGGVVGPVGGNLVTTSAVVYAEDVTPYTVEYYLDGQLWGMVNYGYRRGWPYVKAVPDDLSFPNIDEIELVSSSIADPWRSTKEEIIATGGVLRYYWVRKGGVSQPAETPTETPVEQPVETPAEQPAEQPVEQPAEQPTEKPVATSAEQPISVAVIAISESDGPLSHYYVTIKPGETKTVETPKVDGYKLDQYTSPTYELTYDNALKQLNSAGFAWVQFWMIKDAAPETPVEQPAEQPADQPVETPAEQPAEVPVEQPVETPAEQPIEKPVEQPVEIPAETPTEKPVETPTETPAEQPVEKPVEKPAETPVEQLGETSAEQPVEKPIEQPVDTPTDKPVEQLTDASSLTDQTAGKAQPVATTDKKKVDNSTPSTSHDTAKPTTKSLPKTGDSGSMLLVLGGVLSGLSGLGLAARSRKRD